MIYSLDRILHLEVLVDERFKIPDSFNPSEYFEESYGVIIDDDLDVEREASGIGLDVFLDNVVERHFDDGESGVHLFV